MNSYFRTWFLMHILSKEIPDERNTQIVQKEDKPMILKQAWEQVPVKLIACTWIDKLHHVCSLHFHAVSLLQERTQRRQGQGMSHADAVSPRQKPRNFFDTSLDGEELVRRGGRKLHASQGKNLESYLQNTTLFKKLGLNMI